MSMNVPPSQKYSPIEASTWTCGSRVSMTSRYRLDGTSNRIL